MFNCLDHVWSHRSAHDPRKGGGGASWSSGYSPLWWMTNPVWGKEVYLSGHGPRRPQPVVIPGGVKTVWTARPKEGPSAVCMVILGGVKAEPSARTILVPPCGHDTSYGRRRVGRLGKHPVMDLRRTRAWGKEACRSGYDPVVVNKTCDCSRKAGWLLGFRPLERTTTMRGSPGSSQQQS